MNLLLKGAILKQTFRIFLKLGSNSVCSRMVSEVELFENIDKEYIKFPLMPMEPEHYCHTFLQLHLQSGGGYF